jgi:hypothetical protein
MNYVKLTPRFEYKDDVLKNTGYMDIEKSTISSGVFSALMNNLYLVGISPKIDKNRNATIYEIPHEVMGKRVGTGFEIFYHQTNLEDNYEKI